MIYMIEWKVPEDEDWCVVPESAGENQAACMIAYGRSEQLRTDEGNSLSLHNVYRMRRYERKDPDGLE